MSELVIFCRNMKDLMMIEETILDWEACGEYKGKVFVARGTQIFPETPPRGRPMEETLTAYRKRALTDQGLILEQKDEISQLTSKLHNCQQRLMKRGIRS